MKNKALSSVLRVLTIIAVFILCLASIFMLIVSLTFGDREFYTESITDENIKLAVSDRAMDYFKEKSNQTTVPLEVFLEGYDDETLNRLIEIRAEDTANFMLNGESYPEGHADKECDFETPLMAFADEFSAEYTVSDSDLLYEEIYDVARGSVESIDGMTNVLNLSILERFGFLSKIRAFLGDCKMVTASLVVFTAALAAVLWIRLYNDQKRRGAYAAFGTLWLASAVVYSVALTFKSIKLASRLPIEKGTPLHGAVRNLVQSFEDTMMSVSGSIFFVLLAVLLVASWMYAAPKKKNSEIDFSKIELNETEADGM